MFHVNESCYYAPVVCVNLTLDFTLKPPDDPNLSVALPLLAVPDPTRNPMLTRLGPCEDCVILALGLGKGWKPPFIEHQLCARLWLRASLV